MMAHSVVDYGELTDLELMDALKSGDMTVFSAIYNRYWKILIDTAYQRLKSVEAAEEVVQDIFVSFYLRRNEITIKSTLEGYFKTALKYRVFNLYRAQQVKSAHVVAAKYNDQAKPIMPDEVMEARELRNKIYEVASRMPEKCRTVFIMSRFEQLSTQEIADRLDISTSTVKKHITKATQIMRAEFGDYSIHLLGLYMLIYLNR